MKLLAIVISLTYLMLGIQPSNHFFCEKYKNWDQSNQLKYIDFQGDRDSTLLTYGHPANAAAATDIKICFSKDGDGNIEFSVLNRLDRTRSWMYSKSKYVLNHEQVHFDISELYARKIRKELSLLIEQKEGNINCYQEKLKSLLKEKTSKQNLYDSETAHGILEDMQAIWNKKVCEELLKVESYRTFTKQCDCS